MVSDDRFGYEVYLRVSPLFRQHPQVEVEFVPGGGLELLDLVTGRKGVLVVDAMRTGEHPPGTLKYYPLGINAPGRRLIGSHHIGLGGALSLGSALGMELPPDLGVLLVEAGDVSTVSEEMTPEVAKAVKEAVQWVKGWVKERIGEGRGP